MTNRPIINTDYRDWRFQALFAQLVIVVVYSLNLIADVVEQKWWMAALDVLVVLVWVFLGHLKYTISQIRQDKANRFSERGFN